MASSRRPDSMSMSMSGGPSRSGARNRSNSRFHFTGSALRAVAAAERAQPFHAQLLAQFVEVAGGAPAVQRGLGVIQLDRALLAGLARGVQHVLQVTLVRVGVDQVVPDLGGHALDGAGQPGAAPVEADQRELLQERRR